MVGTMEKLEAFIQARECGESIAAIARRFGVSRGTVRYWLDKAQGAETDTPGRGPGRPPILAPEELERLRQLVVERPVSPLGNILVELEQQTGKRLREGTARQCLRRMGLRRVRPVADKGSADPVQQDRETRYRPHHRREPTGQSYPSDLTDAEWILLQPVFAPKDRPGRPPAYGRRRILDAIFYVVRGGIPWRMLPHDFPEWQNAYAHFRRWSEAGLFEKMHDMLRARWREREGRSPHATGSIIDSQTVKTTEKGGPADMTQARKRRDVSDTSS